MSYLEDFENIEPNLSQAQSFEQLPEGTYVCQVTDVSLKDQLFPEARKISVEFTINEGAFKGRKLWWNSQLKPDSSDKAKSFIKGTICKLAGVETTGGRSWDMLTETRGNLVEVDLGYEADKVNPDKMWPRVYVNKMLKTDSIPF